MNKKAQSHVEIILSFVIFIGTLIFILIFINPFSNPSEEVSVVEDVQRTIITEISSEIGKLSIITEGSGGCYEFTDADYDGKYREVYDGNRKYDIYFSEGFEDYQTKKDSGCAEETYTLGVYSKEEMISWSKVVGLVGDYTSDYGSVKSNLGIVNDFSFSFKYVSGNEINELSVLNIKQPPTGVNVESKEFPVRVIDDSAQIHELILNIRGW